MTDQEFTDYMTEEYKNKSIDTITRTVEYLRNIEKENAGDGYATLADLKERGIIKDELYEAIKSTLDYPDKDVTVTLTE